MSADPTDPGTDGADATRRLALARVVAIGTPVGDHGTVAIWKRRRLIGVAGVAAASVERDGIDPDPGPLRPIDIELFGPPEDTTVAVEPAQRADGSRAPRDAERFVDFLAQVDRSLDAVTAGFDRLDHVSAVLVSGTTPPPEMASWPASDRQAAAAVAATRLEGPLFDAGAEIDELQRMTSVTTVAISECVEALAAMGRSPAEFAMAPRLGNVHAGARRSHETLSSLVAQLDAVARSYPVLARGADEAQRVRDRLSHVADVTAQWVGRFDGAATLDLTGFERAATAPLQPPPVSSR